MRNPFKRQPHLAEKPTLQERAAALKISMARLIRGRHNFDFPDQFSSASLPQGSVEDPSATTFIDPHRTRHDDDRGVPNSSGCTAAADGHAPHQERTMGRHESFDPNTVIPMPMKIIGTVLPKAEPACAEAGIAAMLSKPEPEYVRLSQAALTEALSGNVSAAVRAAIKDHAHALRVGADDSDHSDEAFDRHSARQNETDEQLRSVRCQSLSDLRAKLTYLIPISRPDLLDQRVGDHLEGLLADVDALSQAQAEPDGVKVGIAAMLTARLAAKEHPQTVLPVEPLLAEACLAQVERLTHWDVNVGSLTEEQADAEMVRWGTISRRAIEEPSAGLVDLAAKARLMQDDMRRFMPEDDYPGDDYRLMRTILSDIVALASSEAPPQRPTTESDTILPAIREGGRLKTGEADPIFAALAESRRLYALWQSTYDAWPHGSIEPPDVLARMNGGCRAFMDHLSATVLTTVPTSLTGCTALGRYVLELFEREEIDGDEHGKLGLQTITEGLRALPVKTVAVYPPMHADEIGLARMVVEFFSETPTNTGFDGEIALRDRAHAILTASDGTAIPTATESNAAPDPVYALIAEHRTAYAEWDVLSQIPNNMLMSDPRFKAAEAAAAGPGRREVALLDALVAARPTTFAGIAALAEYLPSALRQVDPDLQEPDSEVALRNIAIALRALDTPDPIFAGVAETRVALDRARALEASATGDLPPAWHDARDETIELLQERVLAFVPTTLDACRAAVRIVLDLRPGLGLDMEEETALLLERIAGVREAVADAPVSSDTGIGQSTTRVLAAINAHEEAWKRSGKVAAHHDAVADAEGQHLVAAEGIDAAEVAAEAKSDQAWRDLFKAQPQDLHELWLLLAHIERHHAGHHGMADAPDIWGTLTGAVAAMRTASQAPKVLPHDLSKLTIPQLSSLYDISWQQRDILLAIESQPRCTEGSETGFKTNTPLGDIVETEGARFAFLGDDVLGEMERRRPTSDDDRNLILETRIRHDLNCNCVIGPELVTEIVASWGAK